MQYSLDCGFLHTHFDLTNTCIRECITIVKIDKEAFEQLNAFAAVIVSEQEPELCVYSKTLAKSCFNLQCEHGRNWGNVQTQPGANGGDKIWRKLIGLCRISGSKQKGVEMSFQLVSVARRASNEKLNFNWDHHPIHRKTTNAPYWSLYSTTKVWKGMTSNEHCKVNLSKDFSFIFRFLKRVCFT